MKIFIFAALHVLLSLAARAENPEYCASIRGNGENVAAHWAALSRFVEENGMPKSIAGGSSGTISMFLLDSMAGNPLFIGVDDQDKKNKMQGLMIKSMGEFLSQMGKNDEALSAQEFMRDLSDPNSGLVERLKKMAQIPGKLSNAEISKAFDKYIRLINPEILRGLKEHPLFFKNEVMDAISVFGKFDAVNDKNLFLRPGLVDFKEVAVNLGTMADFYQGNTDEETRIGLNSYVEDCAANSYQKDWHSLPEEGCKARFKSLVANYLKKGAFQHKALFEPVGKNVPAIPTTALVKGDGLKRYSQYRKSYSSGDAKTDYAKFSVDFEKDVSFGYWTDEGEKIRANLPAGDLKSQKFQELKKGNWFEVLSTSAAEPGLAELQRIPENTTREQVLAEREKSYAERWKGLSYKKNVISAGGWSDLHPTLVQKASGCKRIGYFTRIGGETKFGQQVFIRLTGTQNEIPFWANIADHNSEGWNVEGTQAALTPWNQLYNSGNPQSSFQKSLRVSDFVYCTDWDSYEPLKTGKKEMESNAYGSPVFAKPGMPRSFQVNGNSPSPDPKKFPGCLPLVRGAQEAGTDESAGARAAD